MIDIIVPTFRRPKNVLRLVDNLKSNTVVQYNLLFMVESIDDETRWSLTSCSNQKYVVGNFKSYANAFNCGYMLTKNQFVFMGSDDIEFYKDWDIEALRCFDNVNCSVVGVNASGLLSDKCDLHFLFRRKYVETESLVVGSPNLPIFPYHHNFVDTELYWTARHRGVFQPCPTSIVKHLRPDTDTDSTYLKNNSRADLDMETYNSRKHLFRGV